MEITGKRIVVTGAASGIGRSLVVRLSEMDCELLAADRDQAGLEAVEAHLQTSHGRLHTHVCDLADPQQVDTLFEAAIAKLGGIDIFIANAGFPYFEVLAEPDWAHIERIFQVNVYSPIYAAQKMKTLHPNGGYKVAITASAMGKLGLPGYALYGASKAALDRFADAYRYELPDPSCLMLTYPIATHTRFFVEAAAKTAPVPWPSQTSEQVAKAILKGIQRDCTAVYPSKLFWLVWKLGAVFPWLYRLEQRIELARLRAWLEE